MPVHQPGGGIADPQVALQGQGREAGLGLADEVDGQEPHPQRELGALEEGSGDQRALVMAEVTLEGLAGSHAQHAVGRTPTARTAKTLRPARPFQRRLALSLGSELLEQLKQRHPGLKLNTIHGHDTPLGETTQYSVRPSVAQPVSLAEDSC